MQPIVLYKKQNNKQKQKTVTLPKDHWWLPHNFTSSTGLSHLHTHKKCICSECKTCGNDWGKMTSCYSFGGFMTQFCLNSAHCKPSCFREETESCGRSAGSFIIHTDLVNPPRGPPRSPKHCRPSSTTELPSCKRLQPLEEELSCWWTRTASIVPLLRG